MGPTKRWHDRSRTRESVGRGRRRAAPALLATLGLVALLAGASAPLADTITWNNPAGGNWHTASNWDPQNVPDQAGEAALVPAGHGAYTVTLDAGVSLDAIELANEAATLDLRGSLHLVQPAGLANAGMVVAGASGITLHGALDNAPGATLRVPTAISLYLSGSAQNEGSIRVGSLPASGQARITIGNWGYPLAGSGEMVLQADASIDDAVLSIYYGSLAHGAGHTIRGSGRIAAIVDNAGLIAADENGKMLRIGDYNQSNSGTYLATNGGILKVAGITLTQTETGTVLADGGRAIIEGGQVNGGRFATAGAGACEWAASVMMNGVTNLGDSRVPSGQGVYVTGGLTNDGTVTINPESADPDAVVYFYGYDQPLQGSGEIVLQAGATDVNDARIVAYWGSFVQAADHTIRGSGHIGVPLTNHGLICADASGRTLVLGEYGIANQGLLQAIADGRLRVATTVTQSGAGRILADGGAVTLASQVTGGRIEASPGSAVECHSGARISNAVFAGQAKIPGGQGPELAGATTINEGRITINSDASAANALLYISAWSHELGGDGEILMQTTGSDIYDARLLPYWGSLIQAAEHTIRGEGSVEVGLVNRGTVLADAAGRELVLHDQSKTNQGWMRAQDGGRLSISTTFTNQGACEAASGGTLRAAGNLSNYGAGVLSGGEWLVRPGGTMRLIGAAIQRLNARVLLEGPNANLYQDDATTPALAPLVEIRNGGVLELAGGTDLSTPGALTVSHGQLIVGAGSTLSVPGLFTMTGIAEADSGRVRVDGVLAAAGGPVTIAGGRLRGTGTVQNAVHCGGGVQPGSPAGILTIAGDYTQTEGATCYIDLAGVAPGQYGRLAVAGQATLAGRLIVKSVEGFVPEPGQVYTILTCASRVGQFTLETGCPGEGRQYTTHYHPDRVEIEIYADASAAPDPLADGGGDGGAASAGAEQGGSTTGGSGEIGARTPGSEIPAAISLSALARGDGRVMLALALPEAAEVEVSLFDFSGRRVALLREGLESLGLHTYTWDGAASGGVPCPSGVYFARARVRAGTGVVDRGARVLLVR